MLVDENVLGAPVLGGVAKAVAAVEEVAAAACIAAKAAKGVWVAAPLLVAAPEAKRTNPPCGFRVWRSGFRCGLGLVFGFIGFSFSGSGL